MVRIPEESSRNPRGMIKTSFQPASKSNLRVEEGNLDLKLIGVDVLLALRLPTYIFASHPAVATIMYFWNFSM